MFTYPFFGLYSFFPVAGILIGIIMVFAGNVISYTRNFWLYFQKKVIEGADAIDSIKTEEIDKGIRFIRTLGTLCKVTGIIIIILGAITPVSIIIGVLSKFD